MRWLLPALLIGCAPAVDDLAVPSGWALADDGPWGRTTEDCTGTEDAIFSFEIHTEECPWFTGVQGALVDLKPGDRITGAVVWGELWHDTDTEAVMAIALGGDVVWEHTQPIPSEPGNVQYDIEVTTTHAAGAPVLIHVHNHGSNTYEWLTLERQR